LAPTWLRLWVYINKTALCYSFGKTVQKVWVIG